MELLSYLNEGKSAYQVVAYVKKKLEDAGYSRLAFDEEFQMSAGKGYYVSPYPTVIFAFRVADRVANGSMHIACAHTDFPCLKIKYHPEMTDQGTPAFVRVNVEPYGGLLKRTWFDRPLGVAGKVMLSSENPLCPKEAAFDSGAAWFIIPSLAPHLDKDIEKKEVDDQKEMMPLFLAWNQEQPCEKQIFLEAVANRLGVAAEEILDYDLYLYIAEPAGYVGFDSAMISSARIDNVASVAALTEGLMKSNPKSCDISMIALFDNEEIGSMSKQGADSMLLSWVTEKIFESGLFSNVNYKNAMAKSMMLSVDGAHGWHPNYPETSDPTNKVMLSGGIVIKSSATQKYVTDSRAAAIVCALCKKEHLPYQTQVNRSGLAGGKTLGPITASYLPVMAADIGIPMLAMHSARELAHRADYEALESFMACWFS